jgi:hypothetical protein
MHGVMAGAAGAWRVFGSLHNSAEAQHPTQPIGLMPPQAGSVGRRGDEKGTETSMWNLNSKQWKEQDVFQVW